MKKLFFLFLLIFISSQSYAQVLLYGVIGGKTPGSQDLANYNAIEEAFMNALYEHNYVSFNERDMRNLQLENVLYTARMLDCPLIIIWQIIDNKELNAKLFRTDGVKIEEKSIPIDAIPFSNKTKTNSDRFAVAAGRCAQDFVKKLR
jgi:hypothetical protein